MKLLFDFFPIILFFIAYKLHGIYAATAVIIVATILQVSYNYLRHKKVEKMHLVTLVIVVVLGGATLLLQDEKFIAWKPSVVNWGFALAFWASHYLFGKTPIVKRMMGAMIELPNQAWLRLSYMWIGFFVFSGLLNLWVYYNFSLDTWVNFKLFGLLGLTFVFILLQGVYITKRGKFIEPAAEEAAKQVAEKSIEQDSNKKD